MDTWTPLWSTIVESSLWEESDLVVKVFLTMLAKKDADHVVRGDAYRIGKWANKTELEVEQALEALASPDKRRRSEQQFEGRRIKKVEGGYLILNGQTYRDKIKTIQKREYNRVWMAQKRGVKKPKRDLKPMGSERQFVKAVQNGEEGEHVERMTDPTDAL